MARILLVCDKGLLADSASHLTAAGHEIMTCTNTADALVRAQGETTDVICADFAAPGTGGLELLRGLGQVANHIGRVLVATYDEYSKSVSLRNKDSFHLLIKPFQPPMLIRTVGQAWKLTQMWRQGVPKGPAKP